MFIVTTMNYDQLSELIRDKRVSLNNSPMIFGEGCNFVSKFLEKAIGYPGYVVGIRGRINSHTTSLFSKLDKELQGSKAIIEAEVDDEDLIRFRLDGLIDVAQMIQVGMTEDEITQQLLDAQVKGNVGSQGVEVLCLPYIKKEGQIRVTSMHTELDFQVEGITFVKVEGVELR